MSIIYLNFALVFWVIFALTIWFHSDIVTTIGKLSKLFKLDVVYNLLKLDEYTKYKLEVDVMASYPDFLYAQYPSVFTKLISCNICLPFWLTAVHTFSVWHWSYAILIFPVNYCFSFGIYLLIKKLL